MRFIVLFSVTFTNLAYIIANRSFKIDVYCVPYGRTRGCHRETFTTTKLVIYERKSNIIHKVYTPVPCAFSGNT